MNDGCGRAKAAGAAQPDFGGLVIVAASDRRDLKALSQKSIVASAEAAISVGPFLVPDLHAVDSRPAIAPGDRRLVVVYRQQRAARPCCILESRDIDIAFEPKIDPFIGAENISVSIRRRDLDAGDKHEIGAGGSLEISLPSRCGVVIGDEEEIEPRFARRPMQQFGASLGVAVEGVAMTIAAIPTGAARGKRTGRGPGVGERTGAQRTCRKDDLDPLGWDFVEPQDDQPASGLERAGHIAGRRCVRCNGKLRSCAPAPAAKPFRAGILGDTRIEGAQIDDAVGPFWILQIDGDRLHCLPQFQRHVEIGARFLVGACDADMRDVLAAGEQR